MSAAGSAARPIRQIRILVDDDGRTVWKSFIGQALVGTDELGIGTGALYEKVWWWSIFRAESGRIVCLQREKMTVVGKIQLFGSVEEMRGVVPEKIVVEAEIAAGIRKIEPYPEETLDV